MPFKDNRKLCEEDIDIQASTNSLKAYWTIPNNMKHYTRDVHFAIEEKEVIGNKFKRIFHLHLFFLCKEFILN